MITGSNSLITVPVMYQFGIDPRVAVATNMFGLTFMSAGGALPFIGKGTIDRARLPRLVLLTLAGSAAGALLVLVVPSPAMPVFVSVSMLGVALFTLLVRAPSVPRGAGVAVADAGMAAAADAPAPAAEAQSAGETRAGRAEWVGYAVTFALGIYGGFFSGGYVTLLTAAFVALFRMRFVESVATTKVVTVFSSLVSTLILMAGGLVDYRLGLLLGVVMFFGAFVGARLALRQGERVLRAVFLATVVALALKILLYDLLWKGLQQ